MAGGEIDVQVSAMFDDVAEVEECNRARANQLLAAGYRLIHVQMISYEQERRNSGAAGTFVRHDVRYVIARNSLQEPFPPREPRPAKAPDAAEASA